MDDVVRRAMSEWGRVGGKKRAESLSEERRKEIASAAGRAPKKKRVKMVPLVVPEAPSPSKSTTLMDLDLTGLNLLAAKRLRRGDWGATVQLVEELLSKDDATKSAIAKSLIIGKDKCLEDALRRVL